MKLVKSISDRLTRAFVATVLNTLKKIENSTPSRNFLLARYSQTQCPPRLAILPDRFSLTFELASTMGANEVDVSVDIIWSDEAARSNEGKHPSEVTVPTQMAFRCSCPQASSTQCSHITFCVGFLRKGLSQTTPEKGYQWLMSLLSDGTEVGARVLQLIEQFEPPTNEVRAARLQYRVRLVSDQRSVSSYSHFDFPLLIHPYLQVERKNGGWTKGKHLRGTLESVPEVALVSSSDRLLASLVLLHNRHYEGTLVRDILHLLQEYTNVVYDDEALRPVEVRSGKFEFRVEPDGELFRPKLYLRSGNIAHPAGSLWVFHGSSRNSFAIAFDRSSSVLSFADCDSDTIQLIREMRSANKKQAAFNQPMAEQCADLLAKRQKKNLSVQLPEKLAGPEVPLDPAIEMQLTPRSPHGLNVALRVRCEAIEEALIPGLGESCLRVNSPAGRFQLVRNLDLEAERATAFATSCDLGKLSYDGPYSWIAESDDIALELLKRLEELGEHAPPVLWPKSPPMRTIGTLSTNQLRVQLSSQRDWFGVDGRADLDGREIPLIEILAALRSGRQFIPLGNNEFAKIGQELRDRLMVLQDISQQADGPVRVSKAAMPILEDVLTEDMEVESDEQWQQALQRMEEVRKFVPVVPKNLQADLRPYQEAGYAWLARLSKWGLGGCLADDMGLGKTVQTLGILLDRAPEGPTLIVAPTSVGINWERETRRFAPSLRPFLYRDEDRQHLLENAGPMDLVITSYQLLQRDAAKFARRRWHTLVLDEAQFIKNSQTKTARAIRDLECDWAVALTGTPLENHLGELWSLMRAICPGLFGSWERFRKQFAEPIEKLHDKNSLKRLSKVVQPFILRRTKKEVLSELPARTEIVLDAELSPAEREKYDAARLAALSELSVNSATEPDQQRRIRVLAWLTRLRQLACHPRLVDSRWSKSSAKLDLLLEIVDELREGDHRALVFSQFVQHLSIVREALDRAGVSYQYLDGATPANKRQEAIDAFQRGEGDLFLISLKAGGTGLNLTAADYVIHLDPWWNPAVEDQATDRAHRIGQQRAVTVYRLVAKDTIEEQILALHADKRDLVAGVLDGADRAGKMSTDDLVSLIRLSQVQSHANAS